MMDTSGKRVRSNHSAEFKTQVLEQCQVTGASVAKVAMDHGINANLVHIWRKLARQQCAHRTTPRRGVDDAHLAAAGYARAGKLDTRTVAMIRIDAMWLAAGC